ncbi:MAG: hypothetical protein ACRCSU_04925 [Paracoccaceae bacterium]
MDMNPEERALVEATQASLAAAKEALRDVAKNMRKLGRINREAGRPKPANDAMALEGGATECLGMLITAHAAASKALCDCYDDGGPVVFGGGGGR